ncbi:MAG: DUF4476 domain-containing protein [Bacteroidota bacterium]
MKRLMLLFSIQIISIGAMMAQYIPSILNLRLYDNAPFTCTIDGQNYNQANSTLRIENLNPGNHILNAYVLQWMYGGGYTQRLVYSGTIYVQATAELYATITGSNLNVDRIIALQAPANSGSWNNNNYPYNPSNNNYYGGNYYGGGYHHGNNPGHCGTPPPPPPPVCNVPRAMSDADFNMLLVNLRNASFESTMLSIAKTVLRSNYFTTQQVKSILHEFSFESTKLDFAKEAFDKTIDKNNYYTVNEEFSFSSSTIALNNYIASR